MNGKKAKELVSILMESSLYMTLSVKERYCLLARLQESYTIPYDGAPDECDSKHVAGERFP